MEFLKYDDFLFEQSKTIELQTINEATLTESPDKNIKFGICITTYKIGEGSHTADNRRKNNMTTPKVLKYALESIQAQNFKNWKLYLIGDEYNKEEWPEIVELAKSIVGDKLYTYNLPTSGERGKWESVIVHKTGGCSAANHAINAMKDDGITHFCRLDHDDAWKSNHLEVCAKAYTQYPDSIYVLTQARKKNANDGGYMYLPDHKNSADYNNHKLSLGQQCHSAMTWDIKKTNYIKYRNWDQQKNSEPKRSECFPGDWDNTERIGKILDTDSNPYKLTYVPLLTTKYRNSDGKF
jgi:hypothetical protein